MSVSAISNGALYQPTPLNALQTFFVQRRIAVQQLAQALQSGDLAAAQAAFASLNALRRSLPAGQNGTSTGPFLDKKVAQDFKALGAALQAGDLAGAQQAFAALQKDTHRGHHHQQAVSDSNSNYATEIEINFVSNSPANTSAQATATAPANPAAVAASISSGSGALAPITSAVGPVSSSATPATTTASGTNSNAASSTSEIILNLSDNGKPVGPEIVFNLSSGNHQGGGAGPELTLDLNSHGNGSGSSTAGIVVDVRSASDSASSGPEIAVNFGGGLSLANIVFNFSSGGGQSQSRGIQIDIVV